MDLISLIVGLIFFGVIFWGVHRIAAGFGWPSHIVAIADVVLTLFLVVWLIQALGFSLPYVRLGR